MSASYQKRTEFYELMSVPFIGKHWFGLKNVMVEPTLIINNNKSLYFILEHCQHF